MFKDKISAWKHGLNKIAILQVTKIVVILISGQKSSRSLQINKAGLKISAPALLGNETLKKQDYISEPSLKKLLECFPSYF